MASITKGVNTSDQTLINAFTKLQKALDNYNLTSGALAIKAGGSPLAKTASVVQFKINNKIYSKAAGDMAALSGTVTNALFNIFAFYVDAAGAVTTLMGTEGATLGAVVFPTTVAGTVLIGFVTINPTGTGDFVGGTDDLDDATIVPTAVYVNTPYPFDPDVNAL